MFKHTNEYLTFYERGSICSITYLVDNRYMKLFTID